MRHYIIERDEWVTGRAEYTNIVIGIKMAWEASRKEYNNMIAKCTRR
jgi:hypothetical protein